MRLLKLEDDGSFNLTWFSKDQIPPYAILSHTWGREKDDEITFKDIMDGTGVVVKKRGFKKLHFCGNQAKADNLHYFWVDTCCIDKSNNTELTTAINSMFRWYENAARCYVYLSDVSVHTQDSIQIEWESAFRNSQWFTRGWTLQELLAPKLVEFFSYDGIRLGNKKSLEQQIHEITGIAVKVLQGQRRLSDLSVNERLHWNKSRQTTEEEDKAYCLLGIFNVTMPLVYGEGHGKAMKRLLKEIDDSGQNISKTLVIKPPRFMPFERNSRFTGRELELSKLENIISSNNQTIKVAITGLGGVGKTQLAIELVYRVIENYEDCSVFWIPAMDLESLHQAYLAIAQKLNVPGIDKGKDSIDVKSLVQEYLSKESAGRWLLVFDNADDVDLWLNRSASKQDSNRLVDYLPRSTQGSIIFTTRDRKAAVKLAPRHIIEVLEMDKAAAKELLQKCLINPDLTLIDHGTQVDRNVEALLAQLTYLPLAIVQASAYINENGISITDYLSLLAEKDETIIELLSEDFEEDSRYPHIKNPVAITWLISFEQIKQRDNLAAEYLSFMSCVEPKDIPESLLPAGPSRKKEIDAIGTLHAYSFVTRRPASSCLDLHRLVHLATRNWLSENDQMVEWNSKTMRRLVEIFPENEHKNRSLWRAYLPHAICALRKNAGNNDEDRAKLSHKVGLCLLDEGRFDEAESLLVKVKDIREKMLGAEHPRTLISISDLALLLLNQARFEEAEEMNRLALERYEKVFGVGHPDTLISMSNLAVVLRQQGKLKASEELNRRALEEKEKLLGVDHLETLTSVNNLAFNLQKQGKYEAAEQLNRRALKVREKVLGLDHPETLTSVNNLAFNLQRQGKYEAAEKLNRQAFEMREKVLGADHPDTLISMGNLALALQNRGELEAAEELSRKALEGKERLLGLDHPETLTTVNNLSIVLGQRGMLDAAEKMNRRAIEGREKVLGPQHQDTLTSVSNLAVVLQYQGNVEAAEEMNRRALEGREKALGSEHPETLGSMYSLAYLLHQRKEYGPACSLYERACQGFEISLGHDHPRTKSCRNDYLNAKKESGKG